MNKATFIPVDLKAQNAPSKLFHKWHTEGYTLVMPIVSIGNVAQLSADLLISTLWMYRVGYIASRALCPVIGNDPFASSKTATAASSHSSHSRCDMSTALEVFESERCGLVIIQCRSKPIRTLSDLFARQLAEFAVQSVRFRRVVLLAGAAAPMLKRISGEGGVQSHRFAFNPTWRRGMNAKKTGKQNDEEELRGFALPLFSTSGDQAGNGELDGRGGDDQSSVRLPGCGIAARLFKLLCNPNSITTTNKDDHEQHSQSDADVTPPGVCLLANVCVVEGDNRADAVQLANLTNHLLKFTETGDATSQVKWRVPASWHFVFGEMTDEVPALFH